MKKLFLLSVTSLLLASCGPFYYAPNASNLPLFTGPNQISAGIAAADGGVQFDGAFAVSKNIMVSASGCFVNPDEDKNGNGGSGDLVEFGGGYYYSRNEKMVCGVNGLLGFGGMENHYPSTQVNGMPGTIEASIFRWGLLPYIGYTSKYFEGVFSLRFVGVNYSAIKGQLVLGNRNEVQYLMGNNSQLFIEPGFTFRFGYKSLYLQFQDVVCIGLGDEHFPFWGNVITGGLHFRYRFGEQKK